MMEDFLTHAGYGALALFGYLEACCVPISSEVTFGFAGVLAYQGHLMLPLVIIVGTLAELAGSFVSYAAGRMAERSAIERLGRFVLVTRADIDRAGQFLLGRGAWAIPVGRALPFVRSFTSVAAGSAGVPGLRFGVLSLIGTAIYAAGMSTLGYVVGSAWHRVSGDLSVAGYVLAALAVAAIVAIVVRRLREIRREAEAARAQPAVAPPTADPMIKPRHDR
jgi:membrane protein DedA with SNARE-associated domain